MTGSQPTRVVIAASVTIDIGLGPDGGRGRRWRRWRRRGRRDRNRNGIGIAVCGAVHNLVAVAGEHNEIIRACDVARQRERELFGLARAGSQAGVGHGPR